MEWKCLPLNSITPLSSTSFHFHPLAPQYCAYFGGCQGKNYFGIKKLAALKMAAALGQRDKLELGYVGPCEWVIEPFYGHFAQ
jgi:hypothetical protein